MNLIINIINRFIVNSISLMTPIINKFKNIVAKKKTS